MDYGIWKMEYGMQIINRLCLGQKHWVSSILHIVGLFSHCKPTTRNQALDIQLVLRNQEMIFIHKISWSSLIEFLSLRFPFYFSWILISCISSTSNDAHLTTNDAHSYVLNEIPKKYDFIPTPLPNSHCTLHFACENANRNRHDFLLTGHRYSSLSFVLKIWF